MSLKGTPFPHENKLTWVLKHLNVIKTCFFLLFSSYAPAFLSYLISLHPDLFVSSMNTY